MHLPIIVLSFFSEEKDRMGAYRRFANSYIIKSLDYDQFYRQRGNLAFTGQS